MTIGAIEIKAYLIDNLAKIYGDRKSAGGLAATLAKHLPPHATEECLARLADRVIETRKANSFPSPAELITLIKEIPNPAQQAHTASVTGFNARRGEEEGEKLLARVAGSVLALEAIRAGWAVGLVDFLEQELRAPDELEQRRIIKQVRENDTVKQDPGILGEHLVSWRRVMHQRAKQRLIGQ